MNFELSADQFDQHSSFGKMAVLYDTMNSFEKNAYSSFKSFSKALKKSANTVERIQRNLFLRWSMPQILSLKLREEMDRFESHWQAKRFREALHSSLVVKTTLELMQQRMEGSILREVLIRQKAIQAFLKDNEGLFPLWEDCRANTDKWIERQAIQNLQVSASSLYENIEGVPYNTYRENGWLREITPHPLLDVSWYRANYALDPKVDPLEHFMTVGWAQSFKPYEAFEICDFHQYVQPLLAERGINPLTLYQQDKAFKDLYGDALITYQDWVKTMSQRDEVSSTAVSEEKVSLVYYGGAWSESWFQSLLAQTHSNWELWCSPEALEDSVSDPRIQPLADWAYLGEKIQGRFLLPLDESTVLHCTALSEMLDVFESHPEVQLIYTDEDRFWEGKRSDPYFKPDFSLDLLRSHFYFGRVMAFRREAWLRFGPHARTISEMDLWSVALRAATSLASNQIWHIPQVLWHLVVDPQGGDRVCSTAPVEAHLLETQVPAKVELQDGGVLRIRYEIQDPKPLVSVIIPTKNGLQFLQRCVESVLEKTEYPHYEILIVDNQSDDPACLQWMEQIQRDVPRVKVSHYSHPFNYSAINNFAVKLAQGEILILLNNDTEVIEKDWMREMISLAQRPEVGCVGALLLYPNDTIQHAGVILGVGGVANHAFLHEPAQASGYHNRLRVISEYDAVTAACLAVRKSVFDQVGGLDEKNLAIAFNDVDFCLRVSEAGYKNLVTPFAKLYHHESVSRGAEDTPEKYARFKSEVEYMLQRWNERIANRRHYSPHLSLHPLKSFKMAWPPQCMGTKKADRVDQP